MSTAKTMRAAAVQFAVGVDVRENLATCLRMIDEAAKVQPDVMVLPEFCNHSSWYRDRDHSYEVAVSLEGDFLAAIGAKAAQYACYIMVNCTVRRENRTVTGTNILFDRQGRQIAVSDKQVLMGNENNFLERAKTPGPILETEFGRLGLYSCMDGVINETPRGLALRGAQVLLNSLNSFADDEASLHVPVRAAENKVFVVAANKIGPLVPPELASMVAERMRIAREQLNGAGESQIVAPDGTVLAKAPIHEEAVIFADLDPSLAKDKQRPDGTDIFQSRRPDLYHEIGQPPRPRNYHPGAAQIEVAVYQPGLDGFSSLEEYADAVKSASKAGICLVVLPELCFLDHGIVTDLAAAAEQSRQMIEILVAALQDSAKTHVVTTVVEVDSSGVSHSATLIGRQGVIHQQRQLHACGRHPWITQLGDSLTHIEMSWGRLALITAGDSIFPETFRLAAFQDVEVVALSGHVLEAWELNTGLVERAAENRLSIIAASRPTEAGTSAVFSLDEDFTLWTEWKKRPFDGNINYPIVHRFDSQPGLKTAAVYPAVSGNRTITLKTDVVDSRPWWLVDAITR